MRRGSTKFGGARSASLRLQYVHPGSGFPIERRLRPTHTMSTASSRTTRSRTRELTGRQLAGREKVLDAAAEAFLERGYAATTIDDVADKLGATKGKVYYYFRTKGELYLGLNRRTLERAMEAIEPVLQDSGPASERLYQLAYYHASNLMSPRGFMRFAAQHLETQLASEGRNLNESAKQILKLRAEYEAVFERVIADGVESGEFRTVTPKIMAKAVLGTLNWISVWYRPGRREAAADQIAREFACFVTQGLTWPTENGRRHWQEEGPTPANVGRSHR